jgi:hypothetical protein
MIAVASGSAVSSFLDAVIRHSDQFSEIILCAPFIDMDTAQRLSTLVLRTQRVSCGITIITAPVGNKALTTVVTCPERFAVLKIRVRPNIHAKAYLAIARGRRGRSEAMITSANLPAPAFFTNFELGIHATTRSANGRTLVAQIRNTLSRLSN